MSALGECMERNRGGALRELVEELKQFSWDGLTTLHEDLVSGEVIRGSWAGCVISYRRGGPGSTRRDRLGRARNAFTVLWDDGWLTDEEVAAAVLREMARRERPTMKPSSPARVESPTVGRQAPLHPGTSPCIHGATADSTISGL